MTLTDENGKPFDNPIQQYVCTVETFQKLKREWAEQEARPATFSAKAAAIPPEVRESLRAFHVSDEDYLKYNPEPGQYSSAVPTELHETLKAFGISEADFLKYKDR